MGESGPDHPRRRATDQTNEFAVEGAGMKASARGKSATMALAVIVVGVGLGYLVHQGFAEQARAFSAVTQGRLDSVDMLSKQHAALLEASRAIVQTNQAILCIQALEQPEKRVAIRTGDVCRYLLGTPPRGGQ